MTQPSSLDSEKDSKADLTLKANPKQQLKVYQVFTAVVVLITLLPLMLNIVGVNFGTSNLSSMPHSLSEIDQMHFALQGSFVHSILEWSAVFTALFTTVLALVNYHVNREGVVLIIASSLLCGGVMDGFHILTAIRLIPTVGDAANFGPFTYAVARIFYCGILIVGVSIVLFRLAYKRKDSRRSVTLTVVLMAGVSALTVLLISTAASLPQTMYPESVFKRPFDLVALGLFLTVVPVLLFKLFRAAPGVFSFSLLISLIPQIVGQIYLAFGSGTLFDNSFHIAHFLKVISYLVPLTGICLHYVYNLRRERLAVEQVVQSQKLAFLGQLSSGAAHEINNPLTVVRGLNEVLEHKAKSGRISTEDVVRLTGSINQHVDRIARILNSLKILGGESVASDGDRITIQDLFAHVLDLSSERAGKIGVSISVVAVSDQFAVRGTRSELIQLLLNLVQNAFDALGDRKEARIQLSAYRNLNNLVEIAVEDNGPGIAREHRSGLFTPFFTTKDVGKGVGLGLGTALSIAQKHGGDITFERFAPGVKVVIELPLAEDSHEKVQGTSLRAS